MFVYAGFFRTIEVIEPSFLSATLLSGGGSTEYP